MESSKDEKSLLLFFLVSTLKNGRQEHLTDEHRWSALQLKLQAVRVSQAFETFRRQGIEPILIKGLAAALYYPQSVFRYSVDIDLAVKAEDFESAKLLAESLAATGHAIDLHQELRHLDTVSWPELYRRSSLLETDAGIYRVLSPEDHLRVLCVHWLTDGGINKDRLWDIYYLIESNRSGFNWDRALDIVSPTRRRWIVSTIGLAQKYLGLNLESTPIENAAATIPAWLIAAVEKEWTSGEKEIPLWLVLNDRQKLMKQVSLRLNPNPIRATVEMEGSFDSRTRIFYKVANLFQRLFPSIKRNIVTLSGRRDVD